MGWQALVRVSLWDGGTVVGGLVGTVVGSRVGDWVGGLSKKPNIPGFVVHKLSITFKDDKLNHWEALEEDKASKSVISNLESNDSTVHNY